MEHMDGRERDMAIVSEVSMAKLCDTDFGTAKQ
jgi:hypothetical protein